MVTGPSSSAGDRASGFARRAGRLLFRLRGYTPLPLVLLILLRSRPTGTSIAVGLPLVLAGESLRIWALRYIGGGSRSTRMGAETLITGGPFALTRNPLYLGNLLLSSGLAFFSGIAFLPPLLWVLFAVQYVPIILSEEAELARRFPGRFEEYAREVPRFLPRARRAGGERLAIRFVDAVRVERRSLSAIVLLLLAMLARGGLSGGPA